jgi:hypothetical protein
VTGADSIAEMIRELHLSVDAGSGFEGEMARLSSYSRCAGGSRLPGPPLHQTCMQHTPCWCTDAHPHRPSHLVQYAGKDTGDGCGHGQWLTP